MKEKKRLRKIMLILVSCIGIFILFVVVMRLVYTPSHERDWEVGQEKLPSFSFDGNRVRIENFRNFDWKEDGDVDIRYEEREYALDSLESVDVFISHFDDFEGLAHIFVSFGFRGGEQIVVSLETRREKDEEFSPVLGMLRQYEIIYVVGSEEDIVGLRTDIRDERVYLYPTKASSAQAKELFLLLAQEINDIYASPKMYHTLIHNCTNEITRRVEEIADVDFPFTYKTLLPGYFDEVLYDMNIIASDKPFSVIKKDHLINNNLVDRKKDSFREDIRR